MTEAAIDAGMQRDLFLALGDPLGDDVWSLRIRYKPLIRCIWLGALLMALGALLAASDPRRRRACVRAQEQHGRSEHDRLPGSEPAQVGITADRSKA
jgi:cytochrome c-type biogenesis protein CcmF